MIKVSIIIPHYNSSDLLKKLLDSIPQRDDLEVIVVDDNSTEHMLDELIMEYKGVYFYKNDSMEHSAGKCRNIGLEHVSGEWLLFADADDYFEEELWEKIEPYLNQSSYDLIFFKPVSRFLNTMELAKRHIRACKLVDDYCLSSDSINETKLRYLWEPPWSKLIRYSLVRENNIKFECTTVANDIMFSMKTAKAAKAIAASCETIYVITQGEGSLTVTLTRENFKTRLDVAIRKYHYLKENLTKKEWKTVDLLGKAYVNLARRYGIKGWDILKIYFVFAKEGIRPCISRKWSLIYIIKKMKSRLNQKGG